MKKRFVDNLFVIVFMNETNAVCKQEKHFWNTCFFYSAFLFVSYQQEKCNKSFAKKKKRLKKSYLFFYISDKSLDFGLRSDLTTAANVERQAAEKIEHIEALLLVISIKTFSTLMTEL